jgi:hypothetical protein
MSSIRIRRHSRSRTLLSSTGLYFLDENRNRKHTLVLVLYTTTHPSIMMNWLQNGKFQHRKHNLKCCNWNYTFSPGHTIQYLTSKLFQEYLRPCKWCKLMMQVQLHDNVYNVLRNQALGGLDLLDSYFSTGEWTLDWLYRAWELLLTFQKNRIFSHAQ